MSLAPGWNADLGILLLASAQILLHRVSSQIRPLFGQQVDRTIWNNTITDLFLARLTASKPSFVPFYVAFCVSVRNLHCPV